MADHIERAREDVRRAADLAEDRTVGEQLRSIDEGLKEMTHSSTEAGTERERSSGEEPAATEGDVPRGDELQQVEAKLAGLGDEAEGRTRRLIQDARDHLDGYRREVTRDW
jgi:hypothetical protein